ncbi:hypothetical protein [Streptomyces sp. V1I1]|uniref:hypothetical protein n=1 Tax=Streptomyces sp. V1I1 TaxID=3042272 RepID=UPI0027D794F6|nr:hypothetical protein [Streptomyces sp. V1I1]
MMHGRPPRAPPRPLAHPERERFARALAEAISDPELHALPLCRSVDQWADNTDFLAQGLGGLRRAAECG